MKTTQTELKPEMEQLEAMVKVVDAKTTTDAVQSDAQVNLSEAEYVEQIIEQLKTVYDPELPINIYDLGLIYTIKVDENRIANITMTLTAPGCPAAGILPGEVEHAAKKVHGISDAKVELTFDPPWNQTMMPEFVKLELGLY